MVPTIQALSNEQEAAPRTRGRARAAQEMAGGPPGQEPEGSCGAAEHTETLGGARCQVRWSDPCITCGEMTTDGEASGHQNRY